MKKTACCFVGVCLLFLSSGAIGERPAAGQAVPQVPGLPAAASVKANLDFGRVPLFFIPNQGQFDGRVAFVIQGRDKTVYFTSEGLTLSLRQPEAAGAANRTEAAVARRESEKAGGGAALEQAAAAQRYVVKLDFLGANRGVKPVGEDATGGMISYYKGRPADWRTGIPTYSRIVYRDLWPGIDLAYAGASDRLKYEFIVHPGADPSVIRLAYRGVEGLSVDEQGRLGVKTPSGEFKDEAPVAFQEILGERKSVTLRYQLRSRTDGGPIALAMDKTGPSPFGFEVGGYDPSRALVLDPALFIFAGFIGGDWNDAGRGIAIDASGNVYVAGTTESAQAYFPVKVGPGMSYNGAYDAFIAKVDASGSSLAYCGYIGGDQEDRGLALGVDASGNAYLTGYTSSTQATFPVLSGYDMVHNGAQDAFVAKVSPAGALVYCTYLGGSGDESGNGIAVDGPGNAYVVGTTGSSEATFCEFLGPDIVHNGNQDAFICKLNSSGTGRYYCGYIGGSENDRGYGVAIDASGNAYITGQTESTESTFPVAVGPDLTYWQYGEAFVAKVNSSGTALAYCGYIAGSGIDHGYGIAVDSKGSAYVTGDTDGSLPVVVGPDLTYNSPYPDAFVAKVTPAGNALAYCGYIGGTSGDYGHAIAVDPSGNAFIAGYTSSNETSFPVVGGPDLIQDGGDGFIARLDASGTNLMYCGYIGGSADDGGRAVAVDNWGNAFVTGHTYSINFPVLIGPDLSYNGYYGFGYDTDAFVAKVYSYRVPAQTLAAGDVDGDGTKELAVDLGTNGAWLYDTGSWTQLSTQNPEGMIAANVDADAADELILDLRYGGLWLWNGGAMELLSEENAETMASGNLDADGAKELAVDFGAIGLWLYDSGAWNQLSGVNVELLAVDQLDGSGGAELVGDFGAVGLWQLSGGSWTQLSGVNLQSMATANTDGAGGRELVGDFGPIGLWLLSGGAWTQWSGVNVDRLEAADVDGTGDDEVFGDFALTGLWLWDSGTWTILSGLNVDDMVAADTDGDGADELAGDFATTGIWHYDGGSWNQVSAVNPENMTAGDLDGDSAEEIVADFGTVGLWLWNGGVWSQISANNPD